jgi:hypothetical protein
MSQIDDKNIRLDLDRTNVNYYFEDIITLAKKALKMFKDLPQDINILIFIQSMKLLLKLI